MTLLSLRNVFLSDPRAFRAIGLIRTAPLRVQGHPCATHSSIVGWQPHRLEYLTTSSLFVRLYRCCCLTLSEECFRRLPCVRAGLCRSFPASKSMVQTWRTLWFSAQTARCSSLPATTRLSPPAVAVTVLPRGSKICQLVPCATSRSLQMEYR